MVSPESKAELGSWGEIAARLGISVRTAQKWEKTRGLPVRRLPGQRGRVFAAPEELDRWKLTVGDRPRWWNDARVLRWYCAVATLALAGVLAWTGTNRSGHERTGQPAQFRAEFQTLAVMDAANRELWHYTFDEPFETRAYEGSVGALRTAFADVDSDGRLEFLFSYYSNRAGTEGVPLYCFSDTGRVKWKFTPGRKISDRQRTYSGPFIATAFAVTDLGGSRGQTIAVASRDAVYHPSQFVLLDGHGKPLGEYWHSGHLDNMAFLDLDGDGRKEILLSGVDNGRSAATLVVLDAADFTGASFEGEGSPQQIGGLPLNKERAVLLFPRSCINRQLAPYNMAHEIFTTDGQIRVHVQEASETGGAGEFAIYTFDRQLNCVRAEVSDTLTAIHRRLHGLGRLNHELTGREVRMVPHGGQPATGRRRGGSWETPGGGSSAAGSF